MKKVFLLGLVILSFLSSCKGNKSQNVIDKNELEETNNPNQQVSISSEKNKSESNNLETYCNIEFSNIKGKAHNYSMNTSDATKKGFVLTMFDITLNHKMSEKKDIEISLLYNREGNSPKLSTESYEIKSISTLGDNSITYFDFLGVLDMKIYEKGKRYVKDGFVLIPNAENKITFTSVKDLDVDKPSKVYKTGKQLIEGNLLVNLMQVQPKENFTLKIDFKVINEWAITQNSK